MQRSKLNYAVDLATLIGIFGLIATGLTIEWVLPPGSSSGRGGGTARVLWGGTRHQWGDIHFYIACGLVVLLLIHIALHWTWICALTVRLLTRSATHSKTTPLRRNLAGAGCLIGIVGAFSIFVWVGAANVELRDPVGSGGPRHDRDRLNMAADASAGIDRPQRGSAGDGESNDQRVIRGSMTIAEAATAFGMSDGDLKFALGLPKTVSADTRLSTLRRHYGLKMSDIRRAGKRRDRDGEHDRSGDQTD